jgi:hypothetical protein
MIEEAGSLPCQREFLLLLLLCAERGMGGLFDREEVSCSIILYLIALLFAGIYIVVKSLKIRMIFSE